MTELNDIRVHPMDRITFEVAKRKHHVIQRAPTPRWEEAAAFDTRLGWQDFYHNRYGSQEEFYHTALDVADLLAHASECPELTGHIRGAAGAARPYAADLAEYREPAPEAILAGRNPTYG